MKLCFTKQRQLVTIIENMPVMSMYTVVTGEKKGEPDCINFKSIFIQLQNWCYSHFAILGPCNVKIKIVLK